MGKYSEKTKYKNVYYIRNRRHTSELNKPYLASVCGKQKTFDNDIEAAKWVDMKLIEKGKEPVNILVRK